MIKKLVALLMALFTALAFAAVDVNSADATQLDGVKGIGPAIAGKIAAERKKGPFKDWDDLIGRVGGIGETSAAKLSEAGLTVNGTSFKGVTPKPAAAKVEPAKKDAKEEKAAAAKKEKEETAAVAKKAKEDAAAARKKAAQEKAAAADKPKSVAEKASAPAAKK